MPLLYIKNEKSAYKFGIWHNLEGDDFFLDKLDLIKEEMEEVASLRSRKKSEWLCSRYLLALVADHEIRGACLKDRFGKPYISGSSEYISISHTFDYTAVIISEFVCGIDIQVVVPKILAIGSKFINESELKYIPEDNKLHYFHVIWGAKEAMYKCHGKKELDFKKQMEIKPFQFSEYNTSFAGILTKNEIIKTYDLKAELKNNIMIVYAIENQ